VKSIRSTVEFILIISVLVISIFISGCSNNSPVDISQEEIDNLTASMNEASNISLDGTYYWDRGDFLRAKETYDNAAEKYREVDYRAKEMFNRTQNERLKKRLNLLSLASSNLLSHQTSYP